MFGFVFFEVCQTRCLSTLILSILGVWSHDLLPTQYCIHYWFCQLWVRHTCGSVNLGVNPPGWLSTWNRSTLESINMTVSPHRSLPAIRSFQSGLVHLLFRLFVLVQLSVCLVGFCLLWSLATWHSFHVGLFPLLVLSTLECSHFWFCLHGSPSIWVYVYFQSVHMGVWPHDILPT